ncbi:MAG TPA: glycosyltransferase family 2 protein [Streptosporangiaceae bacterium]|jgi:glycosyltransferase involved in cell wall biosynthesis
MVTGLARAVLAFHAVKLAGLAANLVMFPVLRLQAAAPPGACRADVSVLVPARDEALRLPALLAGLLAQDVTEIAVLDDQSSDGTDAVVLRAAAADPRVRLVRGTPPPPGWTGKNWACLQLAAAARGDILAFCDADVILAPGAVDACWAQMCAQHADVFSVFPRQHTATLGERLLVPLIDDVLLAFLPHCLLRLPVPSAATANGQLLMFRRGAYDRLGGHAAVAGDITEDLALAHRARRAGLRLGLALGGDLVGARMYSGYADSVRGFGKNLRAAHGGHDGTLAATAAWHLLAYTLPWLAWRRGRAWQAAAVLGLAQRVLVNAKTGRGAPGEAALVPVTPLAALPVYALAFRRNARWKGRSYPAHPGHGSCLRSGPAQSPVPDSRR